MSDLAKALSRGIQRRMQARLRYRRRRDRKIPIDMLGKWFEYLVPPTLANMATVWMRWQLVGYDPATAVVKFRSDKGDTIAWATDLFWSEYKVGTLRDAA